MILYIWVVVFNCFVMNGIIFMKNYYGYFIKFLQFLLVYMRLDFLGL